MAGAHPAPCSGGEFTPVSPGAAATVMLLRDSASAGPGACTCCAAAPPWPSPAARTPTPAAASTRGRRPPRRAGRAHAATCGRARLGVGRGGRPRRSSARRSGRRTRRPASCSPGGTAGTPSSATPRATDWEADRAALVARELSFAEFLDRRGLVLRSRPARRVGALDHPGVRAPPLRHLVLRGRAARRASAPGTSPTEADRTVWIRPGRGGGGVRQGRAD